MASNNVAYAIETPINGVLSYDTYDWNTVSTVENTATNSFSDLIQGYTIGSYVADSKVSLEDFECLVKRVNELEKMIQELWQAKSVGDLL